MTVAPDAPIDPITVVVIRRRLVAIADEVDVNITRTAFSPYIYEYKDYAVGIVDAGGDLICQCTAGMPVFVADVMRAAVHDGLKLYGADALSEGDVVITNYAGPSASTSTMSPCIRRSTRCRGRSSSVSWWW